MSMGLQAGIRCLTVIRSNPVRNGMHDVVLKLSGNRAVTLGFDIYLPDDQAHDLPTLAHEVSHVGQFQAWGASATTRLRSEIAGPNCVAAIRMHCRVRYLIIVHFPLMEWSSRAR